MQVFAHEVLKGCQSYILDFKNCRASVQWPQINYVVIFARHLLGKQVIGTTVTKLKGILPDGSLAEQLRVQGVRPKAQICIVPIRLMRLEGYWLVLEG